MTITWGSVEKDNDAWETAKRIRGISDVRDLTSSAFHDLISLAQEIKEGRVNVDVLSPMAR